MPRSPQPSVLWRCNLAATPAGKKGKMAHRGIQSDLKTGWGTALKAPTGLSGPGSLMHANPPPRAKAARQHGDPGCCAPWTHNPVSGRRMEAGRTALGYPRWRRGAVG